MVVKGAAAAYDVMGRYEAPKSELYEKLLIYAAADGLTEEVKEPLKRYFEFDPASFQSDESCLQLTEEQSRSGRTDRYILMYYAAKVLYSHGSSDSYRYLGDCFRNGWGVEKNTEKAADLYKEGMQKSSDPYNFAAYGMMYAGSQDASERKDAENAVILAAQMGDAGALSWCRDHNLLSRVGEMFLSYRQPEVRTVFSNHYIDVEFVRITLGNDLTVDYEISVTNRNTVPVTINIFSRQYREKQSLEGIAPGQTENITVSSGAEFDGSAADLRIVCTFNAVDEQNYMGSQVILCFDRFSVSVNFKEKEIIFNDGRIPEAVPDNSRGTLDRQQGRLTVCLQKSCSDELRQRLKQGGWKKSLFGRDAENWSLEVTPSNFQDNWLLARKLTGDNVKG